MTNTRADAAIIGAGPAGCAAAIKLARSGARIILFHSRERESRKPGEIVDGRIRSPLAELGLSQSFGSVRALALAGNLSLWDDGIPVEREGIKNSHGLGLLLDRLDFERWLVAEAKSAGVLLCESGSKLRVSRERSGWTIETDAFSGLVSVPLIVEATGRSGGVLGHGKRLRSDRLVALLQYGVRQPDLTDQRMLIEATRYGWWYAAALPDRMAVIAYLTDADLLPRTTAARCSLFACELEMTAIIRHFASRLIHKEPLVGYPANGSIRERVHGENWVAIGDAAATYDPLSGLGVAMALTKGIAIARLVHSETACRGLNDYAQAERSAFRDYLTTQHITYARAASRFSSDFWERRMSQ